MIMVYTQIFLIYFISSIIQKSYIKKYIIKYKNFSLFFKNLQKLFEVSAGSIDRIMQNQSKYTKKRSLLTYLSTAL
jgi:hypothetical protein